MDCAPLFEAPLCVNASSINGVTYTCNHKASVQKFTSGADGSGCKDILTGKKRVKYTYCVCNSDLCNSESYHHAKIHHEGAVTVTSKSSTNVIGMSIYEIVILISISNLMNMINMKIIW